MAFVPKTEGTSTTYGQDVEYYATVDAIVLDSSGVESGGESSVIVLQPFVVTLNPDGELDMPLDKAKARVIMAAISEVSLVDITIPLSTGQNAEVAYRKGSSSKDRNKLQEILIKAKRIDSSIVLKSNRSEFVQFNTLQTPNLVANFVYNFYTINEDDVEEQEDQEKDPLLISKPVDVPKYVDLEWDVAGVTEPIAGTEQVARENAEIRQSVCISRNYVVSDKSETFKDSYSKDRARINIVRQDGIEGELMDVNKPQIGFDNIANDRLFPNVVSVTIYPPKQRNTTPSIAIKSVREKR